MKLYIKQKVFSWRDRFRIYDEFENDKYYVEGEVFTLGKKLHLYSSGGQEMSYIHQKVMSFLPKYYINVNGTDIAQVVKEFTFFRQKYTVSGLGWTVEGDFWQHEYRILSEDRVIAAVSKRWFSWGDTYEIDIAESVDEIVALSVVLVIDAVIASQQAAASSNIH